MGYLSIAELESQGFDPAADRIYLTIAKPGATGGCEDAGPFHVQLNDTTQEPSSRLEFALEEWNQTASGPGVDGPALAYRAIATNPAMQAAIAAAFAIPPKS